jgi:glucosamine--fructose-6-phosphate aminotransferase (isomerizing)
MVARYAFEELAGIPAQVEQSADFRYRNPIVGPGDFVIAVSQSGETTDTLGAVREAREKGAETLGVCNVAGSSLERGTNAFVALHAGPEISIASTKAFTTQVCVLLMLALRFGRARRLSVEAGAAFARELAATPEQVAKVVAQDAAIAEIAKHYAHCEHAYFAGRGPLWAVALEGALKLKETSYLHAEGYHAAEVRHGPVSLLPGLGAKNTPPPCGPAEMPVIALACDIPGKTLTLRDVAEFRARGARVFGIVTEGDTEAARAMDDFIAIPAAHPLTAAISATVALQLFAYHISRLRGCDVDKPRNLTKAVLVAA